MNYFLSYAQNAEDVLLWRALGHIRNGFYIDVGANDPTEHSVTRAFYDAGWHGVNVEPGPQCAAALAEQRPRDINLAVAAGAQAGEITFHEVEAISGWSTTTAAEAARIAAAGHATRALKVPQRTLADICAEYAQGPIHFMKIDVEGAEQEVLRGMDFTRWQPWIVLVEAITPGSRESRHDDWESLLTAHGYRFVWFDGLNRYYVAPEHGDLEAALQVQPNVFDAWIPWQLDRAWQANRDMHAGLAAQHEASAALEREAAGLREQLQQLQGGASAREQQALADAVQWRQQMEHAHRRANAAIAHQVALNDHIAAREAEIVELHKQQDAVRQVLAAREADIAHLGENLAEKEQALVAKEQDLAAKDHELAKAAERLQASQVAIAERDDELADVYASISWRITRPVRGLQSLLRGDWKRILLWLKDRQWFRRATLPVLRRFPQLEAQAKATLHQAKAEAAQQAAAPHPAPPVAPGAAAAPQPAAPLHDTLPPAVRPLSAHARSVLADLERQCPPAEK